MGNALTLFLFGCLLLVGLDAVSPGAAVTLVGGVLSVLQVIFSSRGAGLFIMLIGLIPAYILGWNNHVEAKRTEAIDKINDAARKERIG